MKKLGLSVLLLLAACRGATTNAPVASSEEINREQKIQAAAGGVDFHPVKEITQQTRSKFNRVAEKVGIAGDKMCVEMGKKNCHFDFKLVEGDQLNAFGDGKIITVSSALVNFASEDELAVILSHEYAHNIMGHVIIQKNNSNNAGFLGIVFDVAAATQGVNTEGMFEDIGKNQAVAVYSADFEKEADYVGLYIEARAGFDFTKAADFWRHMSAANPDGIYTGKTHPTNAERYVALNKAIDEVKYKEQKGLPLLPELKPAS